jgi:hypothetical protein
MRQPIRQNDRGKKTQSITIPCPTGGWNKRDSLAAMPLNDAVIMDNWMPKQSSVELREGYSFCRQTPPETPAQSLIAYNSANNKSLLYAAGGSIYKMDIADYSIETLGENFSSDFWRSVQYKNRLFLANGANEPQIYDGLELKQHSFSAPAGELDFTRLCDVELFKNRLFFTERDSLKFWHTTQAGAVGGALSSFDLSQLARRGGTIAAINNWSQSGSEGQDNQLVIITSEGEVFVYSGDNPADAGKWALKGYYVIAQTVGFRNSVKIGGDIAVITKDGYCALSSLLSPMSAQGTPISNKIDNALKELKNAFNYPQWQISYINNRDLVLVNAPTGNNTAVQHIYNIKIGAWSRWTGINAAVWEMLEGEVYFAGLDGGIYKMFDGNNDNGAEIIGEVQQAFTDCGNANIKMFKSAYFVLSANIVPIFHLLFGIDFKDAKEISSAVIRSGDAKWNKSEWDSDVWAQEKTAKTIEAAVFSYPGRYASVGIKTQMSASEISWQATTLTFETAK